MPQIAEQLVDVLRFFDTRLPLVEQVIDVPNIFLEDVAEQLVEVPDLSPQLSLHSRNQALGHPGPGVSDTLSSDTYWEPALAKPKNDQDTHGAKPPTGKAHPSNTEERLNHHTSHAHRTKTPHEGSNRQEAAQQATQPAKEASHTTNALGTTDIVDM